MDVAFLRWLHVGVALAATPQEMSHAAAGASRGVVRGNAGGDSQRGGGEGMQGAEATARAAAEAGAARSPSLAVLLKASVAARGGGDSRSPQAVLGRPLELEECNKQARFMSVVW